MQLINAVLAITGIVAAGSLGLITYFLYSRFKRDMPPGLWQHRLDVYSSILHYVIRINRLSTELQQDERYKLEKDKYAAGRESEYDDLMEDLVQAHQEGFYVVSEDVKSEVVAFIDYMSKVQTEGARLERQMKLAGNIVSSMRDDLEVEPIYTDEPASGSSDE
jgi:hypothetical protein